MQQPLLSIVIANYNYGRFLDEAIRSVLDQSCGDWELIICDGGSTDNSKEVIEKYAGRLAWWCSEKDKGQSDAFNKGFAHAKGKFLTWLNADDVMLPGVVEKLKSAAERHPECEWFTGNFFRFTGDGKVIEAPWGPHCIPRWLQTKGRPVAVYGPTTFFTKRIFDAAGGMKVYQNFMMDTDLWMRFIMMGMQQRRINCFCWGFRLHEQSKTGEFGEHKRSEETQRKGAIENQRSYLETKYQASRMVLWGWRIWRVLDGSALRALWFKLTFRHFKVKGQG